MILFQGMPRQFLPPEESSNLPEGINPRLPMSLGVDLKVAVVLKRVNYW